MTAPSGLGMWIAYFDAADRGNPSLIIPRCHRSGIRWLAIRANRAAERANIAAVTKQFQSEGIEVYSWKYCYPGKPVTELAAISQCVDAGVAGHILNPEIEWKSQGNRLYGSQATELCDAVRAKHPDLYLSYSPFALPGYHFDYPYEAFHAGCDSVMPQMYWTEMNGRGAEKNLNRMDDHWGVWNARNPELVKPIIPIGVTYGQGTSYASKERSAEMGQFRMADLDVFLNRYPSLNALSLYSYEASMPQSWDLLERYENVRKVAGTNVFNRLKFIR